MAGAKKKSADITVATSAGPRPRLVKLLVRNFRSIGPEGVSIDLDDIVVLVGPNNVGKSSILKAYEIVMADGSKEGKLELHDFPNGKIDENNLPQIELHTIVYDNGPGEEWIGTTSSGEKLVKERWTWTSPGTPIRRGFNVSLNRWANDEDSEKVPWGAATFANTRRPQTHRVDAFDSPDEQAKKIIDLLMMAINDRVKIHQAGKANPESDFSKLLSEIARLQRQIVAESEHQINEIQSNLNGYIGRVFPGHKVILDAKPEDDLDKAISLFKANPQLLMGPDGGYLSDIGNQGSGARRTLMWTAIRLLAETGKNAQNQRPHVLLLDEPEICLHPIAIREACELLYSLPGLTGNWQIVLTTHSPCFIDFSRDHTSIVRVTRSSEGRVTGTTIYRPSNAKFDEGDRECLKLLNACDPYVAEFFFGGRTIVVEGDTEYSAFRQVMALFPERFRDVHIIRARGKATIISLCKILNQFGAPYAVLHDSDRPIYVRKNGQTAKNPAWAHNESIRMQVAFSPKTVRVLASLPNFEEAYCGVALDGDKPYNVAKLLSSNTELQESIAQLLECLVDFSKTPPSGCMQWTAIEELEKAVTA